jgi:hypothetical protein
MRLLLTLFLILTGCANAPARWASVLEEQVRCGMSVAEVETLSGGKLTAMSGQGPGGTHELRRGTTAMWFDFSGGTLVSVRPSWTVAMARDEWGEKKLLCRQES